MISIFHKETGHLCKMYLFLYFLRKLKRFFLIFAERDSCRFLTKKSWKYTVNSANNLKHLTNTVVLLDKSDKKQ